STHGNQQRHWGERYLWPASDPPVVDAVRDWIHRHAHPVFILRQDDGRGRRPHSRSGRCDLQQYGTMAVEYLAEKHVQSPDKPPRKERGSYAGATAAMTAEADGAATRAFSGLLLRTRTRSVRVDENSVVRSPRRANAR